MREINYPIEKDAYDSLMAVEDRLRSSKLEKYLPDWILMGYGYYGLIRLYEDDGKYYAEIRIGSSCD